MKEKENQYQLRIELLQKEMIDKCNEIGELNTRLAGMNCCDCLCRYPSTL